MKMKTTAHQEIPYCLHLFHQVHETDMVNVVAKCSVLSFTRTTLDVLFLLYDHEIISEFSEIEACFFFLFLISTSYFSG